MKILLGNLDATSDRMTFPNQSTHETSYIN